MADFTALRTGRCLSSSRGVTVSASQKRMPKSAPFKFLRKDEGRLSYACTSDSPLTAANNNTNNNNSSRESPSLERRGSRSLREAIANDMRKGKNQDPFETVVVAVPKRAPPPNSSARDESYSNSETSLTPEHKSIQQHHHQAAPSSDRMDTEPRETNGDAVVLVKPRTSRSIDEIERPMEPVGRPTKMNHSQPPSARWEDDRTDMDWAVSSPSSQPSQQQRRWRNDNVGNGISRRMPQRHYEDPEDAEEEYLRGGRNYFRRPRRQEYRLPREEEDIVNQLEDELCAAKEERGRYHQLKMQLDRERQRFAEYRNGVEQEIEEERAELAAARASEHRQAKKDVKVIEDRYKSTLELLKTEKDVNKKLTQENELLREQLEGLTSRMRETQKLQKAETSRLRREIESLTRRNEELLEMTREQQMATLEGNYKKSAPLLQIGPSTRLQRPSSASEKHYNSGEIHGIEDGAPKTAAVEEKKDRHQMEAEERRRAEAEEKERKRLEAEERRRVEAEEKERKRLEAEERRRAEAEERERKRLESEERRRAEAEEKERKRLEAEERRCAEAEEKERKRLERAGSSRRKVDEQQHQPEEADGKTHELSSQRRSAGHPVSTPRAQNAKTNTSTLQQRGLISSPPAVSRKPRRPPTAAELAADDEATPEEDFPNDVIVSQTALGEAPNKREVLYRSGKREIHYTNGTRKVVLPSGHTVLYFTNGDVKRTFPSGKSTYWYAAAQTTHVQHADGVQVFQFHSSGQIERHLPDGKKEILYPDGIYKVVFSDGRDETIFPIEP